MVAKLYEREPAEKAVAAEEAVAGARKPWHEPGPDRETKAAAVRTDRDLDWMKVDGSALAGDRTRHGVTLTTVDIDLQHVGDLAGEHAKIRTAVDEPVVTDGRGMHRARVVQRDRDDGTLDVTVQAWIRRVLKSHTR